MDNWLERTELLIGEENVKLLRSKHVLIVGLGGIGSYAAEFIARSGVETMTLIDGDVFDKTNKNRQLTALDSTIGRNKAVVLGERLMDINPNLKLNIVEEFVQPTRVWELLELYKPDLVMDCIDSITPKIEWIVACLRLKVKIISHFGAGGKMDPNRVQVCNLPQTYNCNLAAQVKKGLKQRGVTPKKVRAIFSSEMQKKESLKMTDGQNFKRSFYGTVSYMPALFGLMGAADAIRFLCEKE